MPTPREHLTSSVIDGKIYVIGGRHLNPSANYANNEVYDPKTDSWKILEDMPTPRGGIASAPINGTIFVFGGETWTAVSQDGTVIPQGESVIVTRVDGLILIVSTPDDTNN